jgi:protein-S-isoprenylcysteine O-methyltransferase Ste14
MNWQLIKAILILPGTVLVYVPTLLLWLARDTDLAANWATPTDPRFWLALVITAPGVTLMVWTCTLFTRVGEGTPAPWAPPKRLVIHGPYRHVRNPMISGVLTVLLAEALLSGAWPIAGWLLVFFAANALYFPLVEEKGLEARFGAPYLVYKTAVPRWIPRLHPWRES